ncbi:DUF2809 domain-containing protein [Chitinophaga horti]|uniref:DUF2809 domain-containing protein n=1 Tax=Chitinophaga horti TaxID=2920382 RepID=A0ABY6IYC9_9BACT|nr:DUF2809 domain-containing protein [Chitinophaga horti]UYQ91014.1 DUF2809 domain-containing protein [Chitinophaga horti]
MFRFHKGYFFLSLALFAIEIYIALYVRDEIIRPYVGDFLAVIWLYTLLRAFVNIRTFPAAIAVLLFAYALETAQYFQLVKRLGLGHSRFFNIVIGNRFEWVDMIAYTAGIAAVLIVEKLRTKKGRL